LKAKKFFASINAKICSIFDFYCYSLFLDVMRNIKLFIKKYKKIRMAFLCGLVYSKRVNQAVNLSLFMYKAKD